MPGRSPWRKLRAGGRAGHEGARGAEGCAVSNWGVGETRAVTGAEA